MGDPTKPESGGAEKTAPEQPKQGAQTEMPADFEKRKKEMVDQVDKTFDKAISAGSTKLDERALQKMMDLKKAQEKSMEDLFERHRKAFEEKSKQGVANRDTMLQQLLDTATVEAQQKIQALDAVIQRNKKDVFITTGEAYEIEKAVLGVDKMLEEDKKIQEAGMKLMEGKNLADQDYLYIVSILNPYDVFKQRTDIKNTFEATSAGVLVGMMSPSQRYRLVEVFMDSAKKKDTTVLIDAFLRTGNLSRDQGEALLNEAVSKGILTNEQFQRDFKAKLDQGYYEQEVQKFKQMIETEVRKDYTGVFADNIMNRLSGRPVIGGIMALWGFILVALNLTANIKNKSSWLKNPYIWAGAAGMMAGTEIASGTVKMGTPWLGAGVIGRGLESMSETDEAKKNALKKKARDDIGNFIMNSPKELVDYLDKGGYETMLEIRRAKIAEKKSQAFNLDELIESEKKKSGTQAQKLTALKTSTFISETEINKKFNTLAEEADNILGLQNNAEFAKLAKEIRDSQKPGQSMASAKPVPGATDAAQVPGAPQEPANAPPGPTNAPQAPATTPPVSGKPPIKT